MRHMISTGQERFNFEDLPCIVLVSPELTGLETDGKALLFPTLHRKSSDNLAGR